MSDEGYTSPANEEFSQRFKKREGTTDRGRDYENLIIADLALHLALDPECEDYSIASNQRNFGSFDDIILTKDTKTYAMQIKHSNKQHTKIKMAYFQNRYKMFRLANLPTKDLVRTELIFATNLVLKPLEEDSGKLTVSKDQRTFEIKAMPATPEPIFQNTHRKCERYRFEMLEKNRSTNGIQEYDKFFENFSLYTNLEDLQDIEGKIYQTMRNRFHCEDTSVKNYLEFIQRWSDCQDTKEKLNKNVVINSLILCLLSPYIVTLSSHRSIYTNHKYELLVEAVGKFNITIFGPDKSETLKTLWTIEDLQDEELMKTTSRRYQVPNHGQESSSKLLWLCDRAPLIIKDNAVVREALGLSETKKFVLLTTKKELMADSFQNLNQLENKSPETYRKFLETYTYSLQGQRERPLKSLIEGNAEVTRAVTTDVLMDLCRSPLVGEKMEVLPRWYIPRTLTRTVISYEFLNERKSSSLVISLVRNIDEFQERCPSVNLIYVEDLKSYSQKDCDVIFISPAACSPNTLRHLFTKLSKSYHHFRVLDKTNGLEWLTSTANVDEFEQYRRDDDDVPESDLLPYELYNNINIICSGSGTGKTTLMKSLQNSGGDNLWSFRLCLRNYSAELSNKGGDAKEFCRCLISEARNDFETTILNIFVQSGLVRFIWDGLDEIPDRNIPSVINIVRTLSANGSKHWITSRRNLKELLEDSFNVKARNIKLFSKEEQEVFLRERLKDTEDNMASLAVALVKTPAYRDILENPLNIWTLAEQIRSNREFARRLVDRLFCIVELFESCVEEKFHTYNAQSNDMMHKMLVDYKRYKIKDYEAAAIKNNFKEDVLKKINFNVVDCPDGKENDVVGITDNINASVEFPHKSLSEYFAASYLVKHTSNIGPIQDELFREEHTHVRLFFDFMLARSHGAHMAVLCENLEALKKCSREQLREKDDGGRTALHLACSWGLRCSLLSVTQEGDVQVIDDVAKQPTPNKIHHEMVEFLLDYCDPGDEDSIFQKNLFAYACKATCLTVLALLCVNQRVRHPEFKKHLYLVLYYCVLFDCDKVFDLMEKVPIVVTKAYGSLLHMAVQHNSVKFAKKLLAISCYRKIAQFRGQELLEVLPSEDNDEMTTLLKDNGVLVD